MSNIIESLNDVRLDEMIKNRDYYQSPVAWEDQMIYFLLIDRFSNNNEAGFAQNGETPLYNAETDNGNAVSTDEDELNWIKAGENWVGGNLKGLENKLDYLKDLGITTLWVSPIFKQAAFANSYHGYGIQNFLDVDPHFGTREDFADLVKSAHERGIYVILDVILNHSGNVFTYNPDRYETKDGEKTFFDPKWDGNPYDVKGFNDSKGEPAIPFCKENNAGYDDAIWPKEFQDPECFTRKGRITNWDHFPEYQEGDFFTLKDIHLGNGEVDNYQPSEALKHLCMAYKYWIAFADVDGFRIDTIKHMDPGATKFFASEIHEFAKKINKNNFYLIGEIVGSRETAYDTLELTGLDAALGIADIQIKLEWVVKGKISPIEYFELFSNSRLFPNDSHTWFRNKIIIAIDDHDKVVEGVVKCRFCHLDHGEKLILNALALNVTTLGIPCIYYGTEQGFDGQGGRDIYIRESMFGGGFGAFRSRDRHFFDTNNYIYQELKEILDIRSQRIALKRGKQYLREIAGDGVHFELPDFVGDTKEFRSIIPWSRIFDNTEIIMAINIDFENALTTWVTIDNALNKENDEYTCIYSTDIAMKGSKKKVFAKNGKAIEITVPRAGFVIFEKV